MYNNSIAVWLIDDIENYETVAFSNGDTKYWIHIYRGHEYILVTIVQRNDEPFVIVNETIAIDGAAAIYVDLSNGEIGTVENINSVEMRYLIQENKIPPVVRKMTIEEFNKILQNGHPTDSVRCIHEPGKQTYLLDEEPKKYEEIIDMISIDPEIGTKGNQFVIREYDSGFRKYFDSIITIV